jgi:hypothetical protein
MNKLIINQDVLLRTYDNEEKKKQTVQTKLSMFLIKKNISYLNPRTRP